jgi:hypothetical protein
MRPYNEDHLSEIVFCPGADTVGQGWWTLHGNLRHTGGDHGQADQLRHCGGKEFLSTNDQSWQRGRGHFLRYSLEVVPAYRCNLFEWEMAGAMRAVVHRSGGPAEDPKVEALDAKGKANY